MIINKRQNNLSLTYCNLCGKLVGGNGRLEMIATFDEEFAHLEGSDINSNLSINICPECSRSLFRGINESIEKVDEYMKDVKINFGLQFAHSFHNNLSLSSTDQEKTMDECVNENNNSPREFLYDKLNEEEIRQINMICEKMKGTVKSIYDLVYEFNKIGNLKYDLNRLNLDESFEYLRKLIRDNSDYFRLKKFNGRPYIHEIIQFNVNEEEYTDGASKNNKKIVNNRNHYTKEEDDFLIENYDKYGAHHCSNVLNRPYNSVIIRMSKLRKINNLEYVNKKRWSDEEIQFLEDNLDKLTFEEIGIKLDRTTNAIKAKFNELKKSNKGID